MAPRDEQHPARSPLAAWRERVEELEQETYALYLAYRDPRTPWYARALAMAVVAYALSPIDLIPDFVPILGYLDDLVLVPLGVLLVLRLTPPEVMADCRLRARDVLGGDIPGRRVAAAVIITMWVLALSGAAWLLLRR